MPTPTPFFATIEPAGYPQFPDLMVVTPLQGFMPGSAPERPHPEPTPPIVQPPGPVDPGYSPPWAQVPEPPDPNAPHPSHPIMLPGMPGWGQGGPGWNPVPSHPIMLPGMPGWPTDPPPVMVPPPDAAPAGDEVQVIYKYSVTTGLTGPYVVAGAPVPTPTTKA